MRLSKWIAWLWLTVWRGIKLPAPLKESWRKEFIQERRTSLYKLVTGLILAALFGLGLQLFFNQLLGTQYGISRTYVRFFGILVGWIALTAVVCDWQQDKAKDHPKDS